MVPLEAKRAGGCYQKLQRVPRAAAKFLEAEQVALTAPSSLC